MTSSLREIEAQLATLRRTPGFIAEVSAGLNEAQLRLPPAPGEWSMVELLAHLHACAVVWGDDIDRMLTRDAPTYTKPSPRGVMKQARFLDPPFAESLAAFTALRERLLMTLMALTLEQWERTGTINKKSLTVFMKVHGIAEHETIHREQFRQIQTFLISGE